MKIDGERKKIENENENRLLDRMGQKETNRKVS